MSNSFFWHSTIDKDYTELFRWLDLWQKSKFSFLNKPDVKKHHEHIKISIGALERIIRHRDLTNKQHFDFEEVSPFKKAAILVNAITTEKPFYCSLGDTAPEASKCAMFANYRFAWTIAFPYLYKAPLKIDGNDELLIEKLPKFPSKHLQAEIIEQHIRGHLQVQSIALLLEMITYHYNTHLLGKKDTSTENGGCDSLLL